MGTRTVCLIFLLSSVLLAGQMVEARSETEMISAEIQSLERALIMNLIQGNEDAQIQDDACNPKTKRRENYLRDSQIGALTNLDPYRKNKSTYLYVPAKYTGDGKELFVRSHGSVSGLQHAEDYMERSLKKTLPLEFWETNSPCPYCANHLIDLYNKKEYKNKLKIIKFIRFYTVPKRKIPDKKESADLSIRCMAAMMKHGFRFDVWNWNELESMMDNPRCERILKQELGKKEKKQLLDYERDLALKAIQTADRMYRNQPKKAICDPTYSNYIE